MKSSRKSVRRKAHAIPEIRFEDQRLTSFAGLVVFQKFFALVGLNARLAQCFRHLGKGKVFGRATLFLQLIVHILLGFRELRDCQYYQDDPLVQRMLGLKKLPDVATLSRMLKEADEKSVEHLRELLTEMMLERLASLVSCGSPSTSMVRYSRPNAEPKELPLASTRRRKEHAATTRCSARWLRPARCWISCIARATSMTPTEPEPLFCKRVSRCVVLPGVVIEVRMDSAFFSDEIVTALTEQDIEFTISVPFERFSN